MVNHIGAREVRERVRGVSGDSFDDGRNAGQLTGRTPFGRSMMEGARIGRDAGLLKQEFASTNLAVVGSWLSLRKVRRVGGEPRVETFGKHCDERHSGARSFSPWFGFHSR